MDSSNSTPPETSKGEGRSSNIPVELKLARWTDRFMAWLVDFVIVSIGLGILFALIAHPVWPYYYGDEKPFEQKNIRPLHYLISSLVFFAYWTYFESTSGQSIGKRLLIIKTMELSGNKVDIKYAAIESFGKSFLLPIDVILGWIFTNNRRQRIFKRISNTIVVKLKPGGMLSLENVRFTND